MESPCNSGPWQGVGTPHNNVNGLPHVPRRQDAEQDWSGWHNTGKGEQVREGRKGQGRSRRSRVGLVCHIEGLPHPHAEVVAVCDLDDYRLQRVARKFDIPRCYTSYDEMLTDTDINTIDVMTPTYLHRPMAVAAARAGKNIHCEKPLALTLAEGEQYATRPKAQRCPCG